MFDKSVKTVNNLVEERKSIFKKLEIQQQRMQDQQTDQRETIDELMSKMDDLSSTTAATTGLRLEIADFKQQQQQQQQQQPQQQQQSNHFYGGDSYYREGAYGNFSGAYGSSPPAAPPTQAPMALLDLTADQYGTSPLPAPPQSTANIHSYSQNEGLGVGVGGGFSNTLSQSKQPFSNDGGGGGGGGGGSNDIMMPYRGYNDTHSMYHVDTDEDEDLPVVEIDLTRQTGATIYYIQTGYLSLSLSLNLFFSAVVM